MVSFTKLAPSIAFVLPTIAPRSNRFLLGAKEIGPVPAYYAFIVGCNEVVSGKCSGPNCRRLVFERTLKNPWTVCSCRGPLVAYKTGALLTQRTK